MNGFILTIDQILFKMVSGDFREGSTVESGELVALPEDPSSLLSTHMAAHNHPNLQSQGF